MLTQSFLKFVKLKIEAECVVAQCIQHSVHRTDGHGPPSMFVDMSVSMWSKMARLPCWPLCSQQSHWRWIWGAHSWESIQKGIHPEFETQGRCHQKSKTGVSVALRKGLMLSKIKKKNNKDRSDSKHANKGTIQKWIRTIVPGKSLITSWSILDYWSVNKWKQLDYWIIGQIPNNKLYCSRLK